MDLWFLLVLIKPDLVIILERSIGNTNVYLLPDDVKNVTTIYNSGLS